MDVLDVIWMLFKKALTAILVVRTLTPLHMHCFKLSLPTTAPAVTSWTGCDEECTAGGGSSFDECGEFNAYLR